MEMTINGMELTLLECGPAFGGGNHLACLNAKPSQAATYDQLVKWEAYLADGVVFQDAREFWGVRLNQVALAKKITMDITKNWVTEGIAFELAHSPMEGTIR